MESKSTSGKHLPQHIGIIMDGNGRWAQAQGLARERGHERGADAVRTVVRSARELGVQTLTLFAFSSQNWDRPPHEVFHLMQLLRRYLIEERNELLENNIRLVTVGDTHRLPEEVRDPMAELISTSKENQTMTLCLALSYGGREMITEAARKIAIDVAAGIVDAQTINKKLFESYLDSSRMLPALDLLIRTGGERRISNFFLWEAAYAELFFTDTMWPDFSQKDLLAAIDDYSLRERRFGRLSAQMESDF